MATTSSEKLSLHCKTYPQRQRSNIGGGRKVSGGQIARCQRRVVCGMYEVPGSCAGLLHLLVFSKVKDDS